MKKIHGVATSYKILPGLARGKVLRNPQNYYLKSSISQWTMQYMVKSPKIPRNGCADLRQNHTKQKNHNPFMQVFHVETSAQAIPPWPGNLDMKFGGGTEQKVIYE